MLQARGMKRYPETLNMYSEEGNGGSLRELYVLRDEMILELRMIVMTHGMLRGPATKVWADV